MTWTLTSHQSTGPGGISADRDAGKANASADPTGSGVASRPGRAALKNLR